MSKITKKGSRPPRRSASPTAKASAEDYRRLVGVPVCAVLKDGSVYIGTIADAGNGHVVLHGARSPERVSRNPARARAQISALGGLGSLFGGGGGAAASGAAPGAGAPGIGGGLGGMGKALGGLFGGGSGGGGGFNLGGMGNWFRIGMGVVQFIFPLLKGFGW